MKLKLDPYWFDRTASFVAGMVAIVVLVALAGCTTTYSPFRADHEPWSKADGECRMEMAKVPPQPMRAWMQKEVYDPCMQAKGWKED